MFRITTLVALLLFTSAAPLSAQFQMTTSSERSNSSVQTRNGMTTFEFRHTPLIDCLLALGLDPDRVLIHNSACDALSRPISSQGTQMKSDDAMLMLIAKAQLKAISTRKGTALVAEDFLLSEADPIEAKTIRTWRNESLLDKKIQLTMMYTPLQMIVQFANGMSGTNIRIDYQSLRSAGVNPNMLISVNSHNDSVRNTFEKILKPHGLVLESCENGLVICAAN